MALDASKIQALTTTALGTLFVCVLYYVCVVILEPAIPVVDGEILDMIPYEVPTGSFDAHFPQSSHSQ